jgi:toxin ParE1/3/4
MTFPVVFRKAAQTEFDDAAVWYEAQKPGLGREFVAAVERVLDRIANQPELYQIVEGVVVIAVFNASRNPSEWRRRR